MLNNKLIQYAIWTNLSHLTPSIQHLAAMFRKADDDTYTLPAYPESEQQHQAAERNAVV